MTITKISSNNTKLEKQLCVPFNHSNYSNEYQTIHTGAIDNGNNIKKLLEAFFFFKMLKDYLFFLMIILIIMTQV